MKVNWGTGIVIGMILFMGFIMYMVITMMTNDEFSHDLVTTEYYKKELAYQEEIDAEENLKNLSSEITGEKTSDGYLLNFPTDLNSKKLSGTVFLYRPSNKQLDFDFPLVLSGSNLLIPDKRLLDGRWNISVQFDYEDEKYLYKKAIVY